MNNSSFDTVTRRAAAAVSRRSSIRLLGGASLVSAFARPAITSAGKAGKKVLKACKKQKGGCEAEAKAFCGGLEACLNALLPCCQLLAQCKGREATECFLSG